MTKTFKTKEEALEFLNNKDFNGLGYVIAQDPKEQFYIVVERHFANSEDLITTKYLKDTYNYLTNHLEYGCEDIPTSDIVTLINLQFQLTEVLSILQEDGRIVPANCGVPAHNGRGNIEIEEDANDC